ncbi:hypothetical protein [Paraburkholderia flava]|uniref:hypothetical protein n=1 Tax=Paraburkholderia flava TaxID=2547393 RepID=UPI00141521C5|nr:hypothetical protein [Paraburkholderia flava]
MMVTTLAMFVALGVLGAAGAVLMRRLADEAARRSRLQPVRVRVTDPRAARQPRL